MRTATLLYNPYAGRDRAGRMKLMEQVARALDENGVASDLVATEGPGSAGRQARQASDRGAEVVFACGGDGTVHEVLQGLAAFDGGASGAALGVIPLGSANVVARHLGLPLDPVEAAVVQCGWSPVLLPVGRVRLGEVDRAFLALAGAGPDGMLVHRALGMGKERFGRMAYYSRAARLFCTQRFAPFRVEYRVAEGSPWVEVEAVSAMVSRVRSLGGLFGRVADRGDLRTEAMELSLVLPPAYLGLPVWFAGGWLRAHRFNPLLRRLRVQAFRCVPEDGQALHVQADGEWLGLAPAEISIHAAGFRLMMPGVVLPDGLPARGAVTS